mgnify:CR=1 FL=1
MRVLVIGQGLAGTLFSHAALEKGWDCHVIDAGYASASAVAAGMFNPMSFRRVVEVWDAERHLSSMKATYSWLSDQLGEQLIHFLPIHKNLLGSTAKGRNQMVPAIIIIKTKLFLKKTR